MMRWIVMAIAVVAITGFAAQATQAKTAFDPAVQRVISDPMSGGDGDREGGSQIETRGIIESFPANLIGDWRVSGITYTAVSTTSFSASDGAFAINACVDVKHPVSSTVATAIKLEDGESCHSATEGHVKGKLTAFPASLTGTWTVNTTTYEVTTTTKLRREHGNFYIGGCVQLDYNTSTPTRIVRQAATESPDDCGQQNPITPTLIAKGIISARPPTSTVFGTWTIGGNAYESVSGTTTVSEEYGALTVALCANVKYLMQGTSRVAIRISSEESHECGKPQEEHDAYGAIGSLPPGPAYIGAWVIGGVNYTVTTSTLLSSGPFTTGLIVEVHFTVLSDSARIATRIQGKHEVSDDDRALAKVYGRIDARPVSPTVQGTWVIASTTYSVTSETRVTGTLQVGECAELYYRTVLSGTRTITKIKNASLDDCPTTGSGEQVSHAYGFVKQMPTGSFIGLWTIGEATYEAQASTVFTTPKGAFMVGAFVEVEYIKQNSVNQAIRITTHVPPDAGDVNETGELKLVAGELQPDATTLGQSWQVNGVVFTIANATLVDDTLGAIANKQLVRINAYTDATGVKVATKVTALAAQRKTFLPFIRRS